MDIELFLLTMSESDECKQIIYKRMSIKRTIGLHYQMKPERGIIDPFMIPFRDYIIKQMYKNRIDVDELLKYMINNDRAQCAIFLAIALFKPRKDLNSSEFMSAISKHKIITPFVDNLDIEALALIVIAFVFDNLCTTTLNIKDIIGNEEFIYPTNQYGLTKINGATFKKDGLIFDKKGYYYNYFTNKAMLDQYDSMVGFAKIIHDETNHCDIMYRLDERLSMPESEYYDYTGVRYAKIRGPQFNFTSNKLNYQKTIIVHIDEITESKLLMVIKRELPPKVKEEFWHIEIETLPYITGDSDFVITTFLHGMYFPHQDIFTHIDYTKNQYDRDIYLQKYADCKNGIPVDQYTETKDLHYKIWCIENGAFTKETWYKLMFISLTEEYQKLLNEILSDYNQ